MSFLLLPNLLWWLHLTYNLLTKNIKLGEANYVFLITNVVVLFETVALTWNAEDLMPPSERFIFHFNSKEELKKWHLYSDSEYGGTSFMKSYEVSRFLLFLINRRKYVSGHNPLFKALVIYHWSKALGLEVSWYTLKKVFFFMFIKRKFVFDSLVFTGLWKYLMKSLGHAETVLMFRFFLFLLIASTWWQYVYSRDNIVAHRVSSNV